EGVPGLLRNETEFGPAQSPELLGAHRRHVATVEDARAPKYPGVAGQGVQPSPQRDGLAGTGFSDDSDELASAHGVGDTLDHGRTYSPQSELHAEIVHGQQGVVDVGARTPSPTRLLLHRHCHWTSLAK